METYYSFWATGTSNGIKMKYHGYLKDYDGYPMKAFERVPEICKGYNPEVIIELKDVKLRKLKTKPKNYGQ